MQKAPWNDYARNEIFEGDIIEHPNGESGKIVFRPGADGSENQWLVDYGGGILSRLCLQIGERGQAVRTQHCVHADEKPATVKADPPTRNILSCFAG